MVIFNRNPRISKITEVFNHEEKKKFVETLLVVATLLLVFKANSLMIPTFTVFIIGSLIFIIWISMLEKLNPLTIKEKYSHISKNNFLFSAVVSFSFSSLVFIIFIQSYTYELFLEIIFIVVSLLVIYGLLGYILFLALYKEKKPGDDKSNMQEKSMQNPGEIEVNEIRKERYQKDESMWNRIKKYIPKGYNLLSLVTIIMGIIFFWVACIVSIINSKNMNDTVISAMSLILTIGMGFVSIGISFFAIGLSTKSDEKMKSIANVEFLKIVNMVEDARIFFNAGAYPVKTYTWKTRNNIEMAIELIKRDKENNYIEPEYMEKLWYYFKMSFNHFFHDANWRNEKDSMNHLAESYAMLEEYYDSKHITEFNGYVDEDFKDKKDANIKKEFLELIKTAKTKLSM